MTDPDWEPVMKRAAAIVTNRGGRTCHAAIIARELGIPAVVGCGDATTKIRDGEPVTVSCAEGDTGVVYEGRLDFEQQRIELDALPPSPVRIMMNVGNPDRAFDFASIPNHGVGLARLEFIINRMIGVHPRALLEFATLEPGVRDQVRRQMAGYDDPVGFFVEKLTEGIASIAAAFAPQPVIVRLSDFKSNEYANLIGGRQYEPHEENPMLGFRGASRYTDPAFRPCFELECRALRRVRDEIGLDNVQVMVPFVRTVDEARRVVELLAQNGLERGRNGLKLIMMCELPTNALLAREFLEHFDGMSIGSNDMTQLALGLDRDSAIVAPLFDERDPAVKALLVDGDQGLQGIRQVHRHLRTGPIRPPRPRALAGRPGHRQPLAEPGHGRRDLAVPGERHEELAARASGLGGVPSLAARQLDVARSGPRPPASARRDRFVPFPSHGRRTAVLCIEAIVAGSRQRALTL